MKFNKSAESDFWYVGFDDDSSVGTIDFNLNHAEFDSNPACRRLSAKEMREIANFMTELEKQSGIDTTSTFTTNNIGD